MSRRTRNLEPTGPVYSYAFASHTLSTAGPTDLFVLTAPSNSRIIIKEIRLGQFSEFTDTQSEALSVKFLVGSTGISGGAVLAGVNVMRYTGAPTASSSVSGPSTTLASSASASLAFSDTWNVMGGFVYLPARPERFTIQAGGRFLLRQSTPNDQISLNGSLILQQIGTPATT